MFVFDFQQSAFVLLDLFNIALNNCYLDLTVQYLCIGPKHWLL
jgi:hypothetical protein